MKILVGEKEKIYQEINELLYAIEHGNIKEKMSALSSLEAISEIVKYIDTSFFNFDHKIIQQPYLLHHYQQNVNNTFNKFTSNFCKNKIFHQDYLKKILSVIGTELSKVDGSYVVNKHTHLTENESLDIITEYLKQYNYHDLFKDFVNNRRIFELPEQLIDYHGLVYYSLISNNCFMFLSDFDITVKSMLTLMHEFGHVIDYEIIKKKYGLNDKLKFNMQSVYNESISKLHEKEFLHFLIDNDVCKEEAKDLLIDYYYLDYDTIFSLYILTYLPDYLLIKEKYKQLSKSKLFSYLPSKLRISENNLYQLNPDLSDNINYGYGAIISEFLHSNNELTEGFYNYYRAKLFDPEFLIQNDLSALKFQKIYSKKIDKLNR